MIGQNFKIPFQQVLNTFPLLSVFGFLDPGPYRKSEVDWERSSVDIVIFCSDSRLIQPPPFQYYLIFQIYSLWFLLTFGYYDLKKLVFK